MDIFEEEFVNLIQALQANEVSYIFVGGIATNLNGFSRTTADVGIWLKDNIENRKKMRKALNDLGVGDFPNIETTQFIPDWSALTLNNGVELDIMTELLGLEKYSFDECYEISPTAEIYGTKAKFLHINFLIENKKKVDRPKDRVDVICLEEIKKEKGI